MTTINNNRDILKFGCRGSHEKIGILIAQLGTPIAPTSKEVRDYLREFLSDRRVIEKNKYLWWLILHGIILRLRPKRSAALYKRIWTNEGSPLLVITKKQTAKFKKLIQQDYPTIEIEFGMRYGLPSMNQAVTALMDKGCRRILLFPMYPQYSGATTGSSCDGLFLALMKKRWMPAIKIVSPYYAHKSYLTAQTEIINQWYQEQKIRPEKLVLSYHGIPLEYVKKGDPYCCMCTETTQRMFPLLKIPAEEVIHTFQSRFGRDPWLEPYTDLTIEDLPKKGITRIAVACPGFTADCLETLDEIGNEANESFHEAGGKDLKLIPCLNDDDRWIQAMKDITLEELGCWIDYEKNWHSHPINCPLTQPYPYAKK
jgi:protoporphyrin/coproporphyrin ferrochelatase